MRGYFRGFINFAVLSLGIFLPAFAQNPASPVKAGDLPALSHFDPGIADRALDPCNDFYKFVCSRWQAANPIPQDQSSWDTGSNLELWNESLLRNIMTGVADPSPRRTSVEQKIGDYWHACMDETAIEKSGLAAIQPQLDLVGALENKSQLAAVLAQLHLSQPHSWAGGDNETLAPVFGFSSSIDYNDATQVVAAIDQGGFALDGRDYYLSADAQFAEVRGKYRLHAEKLFALAGESEASAKSDAATVLRIETALATAAMDAVNRRDPKKINNVMSLDQVRALTPSFRWNDYLAVVQPTAPKHYIVTAPDFFRAMETLLQSEELASWKTYLTFWILDQNARYLSQPFQEASFDFWGRTTGGAQQMLPRWRRCVSWADRDLGEALGQAYVAQAFPPESKLRTEKMEKSIEAALAEDIQQVDWMAPETKKSAQLKLNATLDKIGYPDKWRDYSTVEISRDSFVGNLHSAARFEYRRQLAKIGKPVDRLEWGMTPPTVNAYEDPQTNTINFPAGILQPPYFEAALDDASNYGSTGGTIGHEMTHGFDDEGRKFDGQGNLRDWWTPQDGKAYEERGKCISSEYTQEIPELGVKTNGLLTQGEDTADNGGTRLAFMALEDLYRQQRKSLDETGPDGWTPRQRFFMAYGFSWCGSLRPEYARNLISTNPHSMPQFRVNNVVSNMPEFQKAFACKAGQPMVHANACRVW
jgi:endothelin-converting enzyme/putative endopeptidase